jgi:hypothetical protein
MNELFDKLVSLKTNTHTALFSDDGDAVRRDELTYKQALDNQDVYTDEEITNESVARWNKMIAKMNEDYKKRNENK